MLNIYHWFGYITLAVKMHVNSPNYRHWGKLLVFDYIFQTKILICLYLLGF